MKIKLSSMDDGKMYDRLSELYGMRVPASANLIDRQYKTTYRGLKTHHTIDTDFDTYWEIEIFKNEN